MRTPVRWVFLCALALLLARPSVVNAEYVIVTTLDNATVRGALKEQSPQRVIVIKDGKSVTIPRNRIRGVELIVTAQGQLAPQHINLIRLFEIDLSTRPAVTVPRATANAIFKKYEDDERFEGRSERQFRNAKGYEKLALMFDLWRRHKDLWEYFKQVNVRKDPPSLQTFRVTVNRGYAMNYCATAGCHGGAGESQLLLIRDKPSMAETIYTNFFILDSYRSADHVNMIDRKQPERSLLIQYGLPTDSTKTPHPDVPGWTAKLRPNGGRRTDAILDWIETLMENRPTYARYNFPTLDELTAQARAYAAQKAKSGPAAVGGESAR